MRMLNLEELLPQYSMHSDVCSSNIQLLISVVSFNDTPWCYQYIRAKDMFPVTMKDTRATRSHHISYTFCGLDQM